jgi:hypothetical protein
MSDVASDPSMPDPAAHDFYARLYERVYRHLFPSLQSSLQQLAAITENPW